MEDSKEYTFSSEQQRDLRGLLEELNAYFKESNQVFLGSEVLVGSDIASIVVPIGLPVQGEGMEEMRMRNERSKNINEITLIMTDFYRELGKTGSPLIQFQEPKEEFIIARYRLIPNDIISAERTVRKTIKLMKERKS